MAQTDKFRKAKSLFSTTLTSGISTGTGDTITLASVTGLPTDTEITLTFDRVDADGVSLGSTVERITGTISGSNLTSYTRAIDGTTEQAHSSGAVVEYIWNADDWNDAVDGFLVEHDQDGTHSDITADSVTIGGNAAIDAGDTATTTAAGVVEIATSAETTTGTDATRAVSPDGLAGSDFGKRVVAMEVFSPTTSVAVGDGAKYFRVPSILNGYNLVDVEAQHVTAGTGTGVQTTDIMIYNVTQAADMLSVALTIDEDEIDSSTAATGPTIDTASDDVATADQIRIDIDAITGSTAPAGLVVELTFQLP